jgi:hypothetical protein
MERCTITIVVVIQANQFGADIAYWSCQLLELKRIIVELEIQRNGRVLNINIKMQLNALTTALDVLKEDQCALQQLVRVNAMPISSPSPTPTTHKRGEELKSMSVVSASPPSTAPLTLSSQNHSTQARMGVVSTQYVNVKHTDKLPPPDASTQHSEKPSSSPPPPIPSIQERRESKSMSVVSAPSPPAAPLALLSQNHSTQARTGSVPTQSVSMQHTAKQPPKDDSPRQRENSSYSPTQSTQKRGGGIQAKTSYTIYKFYKAVHIQRLWRSLKQRIRVRISHRKQQSCILHAVLILQHCIRSLLLRKQYKRR